MITEYPLLMVAVDVPITTAVRTLPIPCRGAISVAFHMTSASDVDVPGSYTIEVRKAAIAGLPASAWVSAANTDATHNGGGVTQVTLTPASLAAAGGGQVIWAFGPNGAGAGRIVMYDEARLTITGGAAQTDAVSVKAQVNQPDYAPPMSALSVDLRTASVSQAA